MIKTGLCLFFLLFIAQTTLLAESFPALSPNGKRVCFEAKGNLWIAPALGGETTRLTVNSAFDMLPKWSPDGNWIAFSSSRTGHMAIFIIPSKGGEARRLTYDTATNYVQDWSPDGSHLLFTSNRQGSYTDLYMLNVVTGRERRLFHGSASVQSAVWSPNGKWIAMALGEQAWWRPQYRGGKHDAIYLMPATGGYPIPVSDTDGLNDWPMFSPDGKFLNYISYQNGSANIWSVPVAVAITSKNSIPSSQITHFHNYGIRFASIGLKVPSIVYVSGFHLYALQTGMSKPHRITVNTVSDTRELPDPRQVFHNNLRSMDLSPDNKTIVFNAFDQIWSYSSDGGDAKELTDGLQPHYDPVWSPDGTKIAYLEQDGGLGLRLMDIATKVSKEIDTQQDTDDAHVSFSPDGKYIAWVVTGGNKPGLYARDISKEPFGDTYRITDGFNIDSYSWSPDSRWILYSKKDNLGSTDLWVVRNVGGISVNITRYPAFNGMADWTADGKNIVFVSDRGGNYGVYLIPLTPSIKETVPVYIGKGIPPRPSLVRINFDEIQDRAHPILKTTENILGITLAPNARNVLIAITNGQQSGWMMLDMATGLEAHLALMKVINPRAYFTNDGSAFYFLSADGTVQKITHANNTTEQITLTAVMHLSLSERYRMDFKEICRYIRTRFYLKDASQNQLNAIFADFNPQIAKAQTDEDFDMLVEFMLGKLNVSNTGIISPGSLIDANKTASLGLDFDQSYNGTGLKVESVVRHGPTDQPGAQVMPGEYLLAVDGKSVQLNETFFNTLYGKENKWTELLISPTPDKSSARTVKIKPWPETLTNAMRQFNHDQDREDRVRDLSGGTIAYIHVRMMNANALEQFKRALFGDAQSKKGLILDLRNNPGGNLADQFLEILNRKPTATEFIKDTNPAEYPARIWNRPIIALINGNTAGDAELFAQGLRSNHLAKLVGDDTAGMVAGAKNVELMDGSLLRVPESGWKDLDGKEMDGHPIIPDKTVKNPIQDNSIISDNQLTASVNMLR